MPHTGGCFIEGDRNDMEKIKVSVNLTADDVNTLRALAEKRGTTVTETLRRAIGMEKFVEEVTANGGALLVEEKDKTLRHVIIR
jgi:hypothetical protein